MNTREFQQVTHDTVVATGKYDCENDRLESAGAMFTKAADDGVADPEPRHYLGLLDERQGNRAAAGHCNVHERKPRC